MLQDEQLQQEATRFNDQINRNYHTFLEVVSGGSNILSTEKPMGDRSFVDKRQKYNRYAPPPKYLTKE